VASSKVAVSFVTKVLSTLRELMLMQSIHAYLSACGYAL